MENLTDEKQLQQVKDERPQKIQRLQIPSQEETQVEEFTFSQPTSS